MKAKDTVRLGALRNAKKYIIEAKTAGPRWPNLPDARAEDHLEARQAGNRLGGDLLEQNRPDLASEELAQVAVYQEFLPKQLTPEELTAEVQGHYRRSRRYVDEGDGQGDGGLRNAWPVVPTARRFRPR